MTQKVVITLSKEDLIKVICKHFDLQITKTSIKLTGDSPSVVVESDRERQSEVKTYKQLDR